MKKALCSLMLSCLVAAAMLAGCGGSSSNPAPDTGAPAVISTSPASSVQKAAVMPVEKVQRVGAGELLHARERLSTQFYSCIIP